jgi:hypothetical protein
MINDTLNITATDRVTEFINRVEPFEFEFDGFTVSGEWFKYKTTTPRYQLARQKKLEAITAELNAIPDKVQAIANADERQPERDRLEKECEEKLKQHAFEYYEDTIKRWRDADGKEILLTIDTFQDLPEQFTQALATYFRKQRDEAVNPTK